MYMNTWKKFWDSLRDIPGGRRNYKIRKIYEIERRQMSMNKIL